MATPEIESGSNPPLKRVWYRTSLFNACVIGAVGFLAPGLWNAMNSLGAGGEEKPFLVNAANALLVLVGAVACGISAGLFWASEGAIAIGYPEPSKRAHYLNIWVWWRTLGPIIGNSIVLALNIKNKGAGNVGYSTYIVFIVLQCLAVPVALLLTPPDKVQRADGSRVLIRVEPTWTAEFKALWQTCQNRTVILLLPVFWAVYFNEYSSNFETYYFGVRARALIAFLSDWITILASQLISHWLDYKHIPAKTRLTYGWYYVILVHIVAWILAWVVQEQYTASPTPPMMDYTMPGFVKGAFVLFMWSFAQQTAQNWLYYLVGSMTDNIAELTRLTGILRGQESFGEAVSYGLNTREWFGGRVPMAVNTILLGLCVVPTWIMVRDFDIGDSESEGEGEKGERMGGDSAVDEKGVLSPEVKETGRVAGGSEI
ncbi:hypothetical protein BO78DRAFT_432663 [Aspergillus sclerotiicarbonarius CBS 121057]|uniref:DUF895 domain membrane protein n=1 Tax=Aspergillus sclerotiicarbonarius (strain CBS 121057 / IBT 28362) TaxID=1448318 RepID=A0A319DZS9_ASPSB|nr:hypothetical protein BO78DRAFT_432663 [Aspergillus sclerotiicarbonarius CBS 121057]